MNPAGAGECIAAVQVAFNLSPDKSAFIAAHLPVRHEVLQAEADITERHALASRNFCCNTSDEGAEHELSAALPAPPPNPPKQARTKGRPEGHQHDSAAHGSGRPSPQVADLDAMIQDVAEEVISVLPAVAATSLHSCLQMPA